MNAKAITQRALPLPLRFAIAALAFRRVWVIAFLAQSPSLAASAAGVALLGDDNSDNELGLKIERSDDGVNFTQIAVAAADVATYNENGLLDGATYWYRVLAYNSFGDSAFSNVLEAVALNLIAPTFTLPPISQTAVSGFSVTFVAAATGSPVITDQWRRNGVDLAGATGPTLTLLDVDADDTAIYSVVATDYAGSATSEAAGLTVNSIPFSPPRRIEVL